MRCYPRIIHLSFRLPDTSAKVKRRTVIGAKIKKLTEGGLVSELCALPSYTVYIRSSSSVWASRRERINSTALAGIPLFSPKKFSFAAAVINLILFIFAKVDFRFFRLMKITLSRLSGLLLRVPLRTLCLCCEPFVSSDFHHGESWCLCFC